MDSFLKGVRDYIEPAMRTYALKIAAPLAKPSIPTGLSFKAAPLAAKSLPKAKAPALSTVNVKDTTPIGVNKTGGS